MASLIETQTATIINQLHTLNQDNVGLSSRQLETLEIIIASAEHFAHVYTEARSKPTTEFFVTMRDQAVGHLTTIRGYTELMLAGNRGTLDENQQAQLRKIVRDTQTLYANLIRETRHQLLSTQSAAV